MNLFTKLLGNRKESVSIKQDFINPYHSNKEKDKRDIVIKSTGYWKHENGNRGIPKRISAESNIYAIIDRNNNNIYHVYIIDSTINNYILSPVIMKITEVEVQKITLEGIGINDKDNYWGKDYRNYGIQFIKNIFLEFGTATLWIKDKNDVFVYQ